MKTIFFRTFNFNFFTVHKLCLTHEPCMRKLDGPLETFWSFSWWPRSRHLNEILKNTMEKKKFHLFPAWKTTLNRDSWGNGRFEGVSKTLLFPRPGPSQCWGGGGGRLGGGDRVRPCWGGGGEGRQQGGGGVPRDDHRPAVQEWDQGAVLAASDQAVPKDSVE